MYYSDARKETRDPLAPVDGVLHRDVRYMEYLSANGYSLTRRNIFTQWFPSDIQEVFEISTKEKGIDKDFDGILTLISLAGVAIGDHKYLKPMMKLGYGITGRNMTRQSQRNLAFMLMGAVTDDVSELRALCSVSTCTNNNCLISPFVYCQTYKNAAIMNLLSRTSF